MSEYTDRILRAMEDALPPVVLSSIEDYQTVEPVATAFGLPVGYSPIVPEGMAILFYPERAARMVDDMLANMKWEWTRD